MKFISNLKTTHNIFRRCFQVNSVVQCHTKSPVKSLCNPCLFKNVCQKYSNLKSCTFTYPISIQSRHFVLSRCRFSDEISDTHLKKSMDELTDKFIEARELMEDARESKGTVYFSEDMQDAEAAVKETLSEYQTLLNQISNTQRQQVMRTIGLRMEELRAQLTAMEEELKED